MGAGSSSSPRHSREDTRRGSSRVTRSDSGQQSPRSDSANAVGEERRQREAAIRSRRSRSSGDAPPQAALQAAQSRGDVIIFEAVHGQTIALSLCKPRRLELLVNNLWVRGITSLVAALGAQNVDLLTDDGDLIAEIAHRDTSLFRILGSVARLATRASVPHDLWKDLRDAGIEVVQSNTESCYFCGRQLATAPAFCAATGRVHPIPPMQGWEEAPSREALASAEASGDFVVFETETGTEQKFVFVNAGRLEKLVSGVWKRPVMRLEVPHIGARTLRDYHMTAPAGCMLRAADINETLLSVAILADRAGVEHNLWEHTSPPPTCPDCNNPFHTVPICPKTDRQHAESKTTNSQQPMSPVGDGSGEMRVKRRLTGPSECPSPQTVALSAEPDIPADDAQSTAESVSNVIGINAEECCVCLEEAKNTVLMPCRHLCVCSGCAQILTQCPLCRFAVLHRFEVF
ncbi:putative E3 ubiquitin-protein ligase LOG2 [Diplonema papillatum]|nr:putative E3 ubiquitin-protein ligase LOG2 [Diplonema papillatum]